MTDKPDGLSWPAFAAGAGFLAVVIMGYNLIHSGINKRLDDLRTDFAAVKADVADLKADMAAVLDALERIERRLIGEDSGQPSPAGTTLAMPLPVSSGDSVSDFTADTALPD